MESEDQLPEQLLAHYEAEAAALQSQLRAALNDFDADYPLAQLTAALHLANDRLRWLSIRFSGPAPEQVAACLRLIARLHFEYRLFPDASTWIGIRWGRQQCPIT